MKISCKIPRRNSKHIPRSYHCFPSPSTWHLVSANGTPFCRYDFEYEEDDDEENDDVDIENKYYNAKQMKITDPVDAIHEFLGIPQLETEKGEWGFKGLKQATKLEYQQKKYDQVEFQAAPGLCL